MPYKPPTIRPYDMAILHALIISYETAKSILRNEQVMDTAL